MAEFFYSSPTKKDFSAQNQQILNFEPTLRSESRGNLLTLPSREEETTNKLSKFCILYYFFLPLRPITPKV